MKPLISSNNRPQAVIFDWDNTLVDSWPAIMEAINLTRVEFGLPAWNLQEIKIHCTRAARDSFPEWFGDKWESAYKFYYEGFDVIRKRRAIETLPGAHELLQWLNSQSIPAFVVSNKRGDYLRLEVEKLQWQKHFIAVVGAADAPFDKPHRAHVDMALGQGGLTGNASIWFVGDSETDVLCAKNSDCTPILVNHAGDAEKLGVHWNFKHCDALLSHVLKTYNG